MATHTLATSSAIVAVTYSQSPASLLPADLATIAADILNDPDKSMMVAAHATIPGAFNYMGLLVIPGRGVLQLYPGDVVAVDTASNVGWPILVSKNAIANGTWTYT